MASSLLRVSLFVQLIQWIWITIRHFVRNTVVFGIAGLVDDDCQVRASLESIFGDVYFPIAQNLDCKKPLAA